MLTATALLKLSALRLSSKQMAGVLEVLAELQSDIDSRKAGQRERTQRFREARRSGNEYVTLPVTSPEQDGNVASPPPLDKRKEPKENYSPPAHETHTPPGEPKEIEVQPHPIEVERKLTKAQAKAEAAEKARNDEIAFTAEAQHWYDNLYPEKKARPLGIKAYVKARKRGVSAERISEGTRRLIEFMEFDPTYRPPWPATFCNDERYDDEFRAAPSPRYRDAPPGAPKPQSSRSMMVNAALNRQARREAQTQGTTIDGTFTEVRSTGFDREGPRPFADRDSDR